MDCTRFTDLTISLVLQESLFEWGYCSFFLRLQNTDVVIPPVRNSKIEIGSANNGLSPNEMIIIVNMLVTINRPHVFSLGLNKLDVMHFLPYLYNVTNNNTNTIVIGKPIPDSQLRY